MTVFFPEATKAQGNTSVVIAQTITAPPAVSLATDVNGATSVDASCFLYGTFSATPTQNTGEAPRRLCTKDVFQQFGTTTYALTDIQYVYDPQGDDTVPANDVKAALAEDAEVWLIVREGLDAQKEAFAVGDRVSLHHVRVGKQRRGATGDGEFDEFSITQSLIYVEPPVYDVVIAA